MSCASATSPMSRTTGPLVTAAAPNALDTVPSIPLAPRLHSTRGPSARTATNDSTSRTGIDGTVSSALGAAAAGERVVLLIGDVALAHDLGGLLAAKRLDLAITIVLLDNDGGGIFEFLPIAGARDVFEEHVATPHGLDFAHAAALSGCAFADVADLTGLRAALARALAGEDTTLVRVRSDRTANLALHRELSAAVAATLTG